MTGSGTSFSSSMVGCAFVAGSGITTGTVSANGFIMSVASSTNLVVAFNTATNGFSGHTDPYAIYCPVVVMGQGAPDSGTGAYMFGIGLKNLDIDCNSIAGCVDVADWFSEEQTEIDHVVFRGFTNIGLDRETAYAQNSGPFHNLVFSPSNSETTATLCYMSRVNGGITRPITDITAGGSVVRPNIAFVIETPGERVENMHVENVGIVVEIGGLTACPVACPEPHHGAGGAAITNVDGGGTGGTSVVQIDNANFAQDSVTLRDIFKNANYTNVLNDKQNGPCTVTASRLGWYALDGNGTKKYSTATSGCTTP